MAISYDSLELNISANVSQASRGIRALKNNLEALQTTVKGLDFGLIENLQKHLQDIANIDFSNVSQGLKDVVSAFKSFNQQAGRKNKGLEDRPYEPNFTMQDSQLPSVLEPNFQMVDTLELTLEGWNNFKESVEEGIDTSGIIDVDSYFKTLEGDLERAGFSTEQIKEVLRSTNAEAKLFSEEGLAKVRDILLQWGYSGEEADRIIKRLKTDTQDAGNKAEKGAKGFQKIVQAFKRIVFYRLVRRAIQLVGQAIKEGIQNMALFDDNFNKSMSEIKSSLTYFKNSFASVVAPIIEMVQPILTEIIDLFADINNELAKMFSMLNGKNQFAKATKGAEDYAESLKKAKSVSLGIDELNVVQQDKATGFEMADSSGGNGALSNVFSNLKEKIEPLIEKFKEGLQPIFQAVMRLFEKLQPILDIIVDLLSQFIDETMDSVNNMITNFLTMLGSLLDFIGTFLDGIKPLLENLIHFLASATNIFNNSFSTLFNILTPILDILKNLFSAIFGVLKPLLSGVSVAMNFLVDAIERLVNYINDMLSGNLDNYSLGDRLFMDFITGGFSELSYGIRKATGHANGGFVEDGFFFANHNELVGQFSNGKTAVANNEQITTGIYQAVLQAMNDSARSGGRDIVLQIDGREIGRASEKYTSQKGNSGYKGGYFYG